MLFTLQKLIYWEMVLGVRTDKTSSQNGYLWLGSCGGVTRQAQ